MQSPSEWCERTGKIRYASKAAALVARTHISARKPEKMNAYPCSACGGFHLGREKHRNLMITRGR